MTVDDHAIDSLKVWYEIAMKELIEEHTKEPGKKVSELPSFKAAKAYEEALNVLINACYFPEYRASHRLSVLDEIKEYDDSRKVFGEEILSDPSSPAKSSKLINTIEQLEYLMEFYNKLRGVAADEGRVLTDIENERGNEEDIYLPHALYHEKIDEVYNLIDIKYEETVKEWRQQRLKDGIITGKESRYFYEQTIYENESPFAATHRLITNIYNSDLTQEEMDKHIKLVQIAAEATGKVEVQDCLWDGK